jgi:eukaryotic-like serine/threonine-protein kinase
VTYRPPPILQDLQPGELVDRHQVLYPMARGGMGTVWLARLGNGGMFEKLVVVKTVRPELAAEPALRTMFLDEIRITAAISHGNVVHVLDAGEVRGMLYLVMEYVEGESLARMLRAHAKKTGTPVLPPAIATRIIIGACAGLHAAHELRSPTGEWLKVVHRDVSPQNLLVTAHGATKVIDFGIATARERLSAETSLGMLKGKLRFMPPEQIGRSGVDRRSDIWAIGCILTLMLTGSGPFDDEGEISMLRRILNGDRAPLPASVPPSLAKVIDACLQADQEKRPPTADALGQMLEQALRDAKLVASESDVARRFAPMCAEYAAASAEAMATALAAIEERARVQLLLEPVTDTHSPEFIARAARAARRAVAKPETVTAATAFAPAPVVAPVAVPEPGGTNDGVSQASFPFPDRRASLRRTGLLVASSLALVTVVGAGLTLRHKDPTGTAGPIASALTSLQPITDPVASSPPVAPVGALVALEAQPMASAVPSTTTSAPSRPVKAPGAPSTQPTGHGRHGDPDFSRRY